MAKSTWTIKDIKNDLDATVLLLQARPSLEGSGQLHSSIKHKVNMASFDGPADLAELYGAIQQSKLPESLASDLCKILDEKTQVTMDTNSIYKGHLVPQQVDGLQNYFTKAEYDELVVVDMWKGASIISHRLKMIGVRSIKEKTKKLAVALLMFFERKRGRPLPSKQVSYSLAQHFLQTFQSCTTATPNAANNLLSYPVSPLQLEASHYQAAYGDDHPVEVECPELAQIFRHHAFVRSSCKEVEKPASSDQQIVPAKCGSTSQAPDLGGMGGMNNAQGLATSMFNHMWANFLEQGKALLQGTGGHAGNDINLQYNQNFGNGSTNVPRNFWPSTGGPANVSTPAAVPVADANSNVPLPLTNEPKHAEAQQAQSEDGNAAATAKPADSLEAFEQDAFNALQERKSKKAVATKETKQKQEDNGKNKKVLKRPASCKASASNRSTSATASSTQKLGCRKCRGAKHGCAQCRSPAFKGRRLSRSEWLRVAKKEGLK